MDSFADFLAGAILMAPIAWTIGSRQASKRWAQRVENLHRELHVERSRTSAT